MTQPDHHGKNSKPICPDQTASDVIRAAVGDQQYLHWFEDRSRFETQSDCLQIFVANPFICNWLQKRFRTNLNRAAVTLLGPSARIELLVDERLQTDDRKPQRTTEPTPSATVPISQEQTVPQKMTTKTASGRRFRKFRSLVTGECNQLAMLAAQQVAEGPGERFNPLYIHGPTGVGKTHLLEAIYSEVRGKRPDLNVMYLSSEAFTNYFTQALNTKTQPSFRQKFRNVNVLLVDNVEFLDNKRATQEEFLHTIVQVIEQGGQLVITGDRHPRLLSKHRPELTTRFESGLVCRLETPDEQTRLRIAESLALPMQECLTREAIEYVARRARKNVREIQGALNCLHGHYSLDGKKITVQRARQILGEMQDECRRMVRISDVEKVICDAFGLTTQDLRSNSRRRMISHPRSLAMFVARKLTKAAYREIGAYFGGRDHSTVVAAEKRVQQWLDQDANFELPSSCNGRSVAEILQELEERLFSMVA